MSHIPRNLEYLNRRRIVYRRDPINDRPSMKHRDYDYYENGTHECYSLFRSRAKITTYKSLKWHMLVLWYLNPQLDPDDFTSLCNHIADKSNGFITFTVPPQLLKKIIYEVSMMELDEPPLNDMGKKITLARIAGLLDCSTRTIQRNMCEELKREKELLNQQI